MGRKKDEKKIEKLRQLVRRKNGASLAEIAKATGWHERTVLRWLPKTVVRLGVGRPNRYRLDE